MLAEGTSEHQRRQYERDESIAAASLDVRDWRIARRDLIDYRVDQRAIDFDSDFSTSAAPEMTPELHEHILVGVL